MKNVAINPFIRLFLPVLLILTLFGACEPNKKRIFIQILDKKAAEIAICTDTIAHFFAHISPLEMAIQMKTDSNGLKPAPKLAYMAFLRQEAQAFSPAEAACADRQLQKALAYSYKISPNLRLPDTIQIAKIAGDAYGAQTFFTRQNTIFIPEAVLLGGQAEGVYSTLIHEIFHLYSRYNPEIKQKLFAELGFRPLPHLELNNMLKKRIFYNPDAVDIRYAIQVADAKGRKMEVVPIIFSRFGSYGVENGAFFQHLEFRLFEITAQKDSFFIAADHTGYEAEELRNFFAQIGRNTNYIIHPEEILADNFKLLALQKAGIRTVLLDIDEQGKLLLKKIEKILLEQPQMSKNSSIN